MPIQINGIYEYDTGRKDLFHQCQEVYRIYVYGKRRQSYKCFINQTGTDRLAHEYVGGKWLIEKCKYIGPASTTWKDLFKVKEGENGI